MYGDDLCKYVTAKECTATLYGVPDKSYNQTNHDLFQEACLCMPKQNRDMDQNIDDIHESRNHEFIAQFKSDKFKDYKKQDSSGCPNVQNISVCTMDIKSAGDTNIVDSSLSCGADVKSDWPVDCEVSDWSEWSDCSKECGGGVETRTRTVLKEAKKGGEACPVLTESRNCNQTECRGCVLSDWVNEGNCVNGKQKQIKNILVKPQPGGTPCGEMVQYIPAMIAK
jgi:hypothetical protein